MAYPELRRHRRRARRPALRCCADPDKVEQVLTNLVENAAKYADPGGVRIARPRPPTTRSTVAVADHGAGHPGRGPAPGVRPVLPPRPGPAHRHRPRPVDQPAAGRGPRRLADRRVGGGRGRRSSASRCPLGDRPPTARPMNLPHGRAIRHCSQTMIDEIAPAHGGRAGRVPPPRPTSTSCGRSRPRLLGKRAAVAGIKRQLGGLDARRAQAGRPGARTRRSGRVEAVLGRAPRRAGVGRPPGAARGRAARPHRGAGRPRRRPPPPGHPGHRGARGRLRRARASPWPRAPRSRTTGTTSPPSTSASTTRPATCRTPSSSTSASPARWCCAPTPRRCRSG